MKISNYLIILLTSVLFIGCADNEPIIPQIETNIQSYYYGYINNNTAIQYSSETDNLVKLEYQGNDIVRRVGGLITVNPATGFSYKFIDDIFEELVYERNNQQLTILITGRYITEENDFSFNERILKLNTQNQMLERIVENTSTHRYDTINYSYNSLGQIIKSIRRIPRTSYTLIKESDYYYSTKQNLDSVLTYISYDEEYFLIKKEVFSDYDEALNPLKKLMIFDDTYFRSLSENNFSKYQIFKYDEFGDITEEEEFNWTYFYDESGNIDFSMH